MTTPDGNPSTPVTAVPKVFGAVDVATQAAAGEATVIGTDQDRSVSGRPDAASGMSSLTGGVAMAPGDTPPFRRD